jgi:hypothetical protein
VAHITIAVEGPTDKAIADRLCAEAGHEVAYAYITDGKHELGRRLSGFNEAARWAPWFVLRDLDDDAACAPRLRRRLMPQPSPRMCLRIAVRSVEAWLLADAKGLSRFLGVPQGRVPPSPESLARPKRSLVDLAGESRWPAVRADMVPARGLSREVGTGYTVRVIEFVRTGWDPARARDRSESLTTCMNALSALS